MTHKEKAEHHAYEFYKDILVCKHYQLPHIWRSEGKTLIRRHWREHLKRKTATEARDA